MGYDPDGPSLTSAEADKLYERIYVLEDIMQTALSFLEGDPECANAKPGLIVEMKAALKRS